ncbi:MAG: TlpA disulfide reductase family protein [Fimbriimonadaceae bacterium]
MNRTLILSLCLLPVLTFAQNAQLGAMSKKLQSLKRLSGTAVITKKGMADQTVKFSLAKPNRFEIKGGGLDCKFDGTRRYALKGGNWIPAGKDSSLPATLSCLSPFFGKAYPSTSLASVSGIKGQGYKVASGQVVFINTAIQMPGKQVVFEKNGTRSLVSFRVLNFAKPKVVASTSTAGAQAQPIGVGRGKASQPAIPISVGKSSTTLKDIGNDPQPEKDSGIGRAKPKDPLKQGGTDETRENAAPGSIAAVSGKLPQVGQTLENFTAPTPDGNSVDLGVLAKKVNGVLLVFWNRDCPASAQYLPLLLSQRQMFRDKKIALVGVNCGDDPKAVRAYLKSKNLDLLTVAPTENLQLKYGVMAFPTTIAMSSAGKVLGTFVGADSEGLKALLPAFGL